MEIQGKITNILEEQIIETKKGQFKKRQLWIETTGKDGAYPQLLDVDFLGDKTGVLDSYEVGQQVEIGINLQGRKWTNDKGKDIIFKSIVGWRIKEVGGQVESVTDAPVESSDEDDLPF